MKAELKERTIIYKKSCLLCDPSSPCKHHNTHVKIRKNKYTQNYTDTLIYILHIYSYIMFVNTYT